MNTLYCFDPFCSLLFSSESFCWHILMPWVSFLVTSLLMSPWKTFFILVTVVFVSSISVWFLGFLSLYIVYFLHEGLFHINHTCVKSYFSESNIPAIFYSASDVSLVSLNCIFCFVLHLFIFCISVCLLIFLDSYTDVFGKKSGSK